MSWGRECGGLLIRKMEDGDAAAALRCEICLKRPNVRGGAAVILTLSSRGEIGIGVRS
jgi:hypothetical protein